MLLQLTTRTTAHPATTTFLYAIINVRNLITWCCFNVEFICWNYQFEGFWNHWTCNLQWQSCVLSQFRSNRDVCFFFLFQKKKLVGNYFSWLHNLLELNASSSIFFYDNEEYLAMSWGKKNQYFSFFETIAFNWSGGGSQIEFVTFRKEFSYHIPR